jgi:ElaA protein
MMMQWQWLSFAQLGADALYSVMAQRQQVFVLEQQCLYQDLDGLDLDAWHLLAWDGQQEGGRRHLVAYLRCLAPGIKYDEVSLGRVLTAQSARRQGLGRMLMGQAVQRAGQQFPGHGIRISAQLYLQHFYAGFGFLPTSAPYDEDGIAHVEMLRQPPQPAG